MGGVHRLRDTLLYSIVLIYCFSVTKGGWGVSIAVFGVTYLLNAPMSTGLRQSGKGIDLVLTLSERGGEGVKRKRQMTLFCDQIFDPVDKRH